MHAPRETTPNYVAAQAIAPNSPSSRIRPESVFLVTKKGHHQALTLAGHISTWLDAHGVSNAVTENREDLDHCLPHQANALVLVLGGDGTMISVARRICGENIVLLGLNFARVGFLTECTQDRWQIELESILTNGVSISPRMLLDVRVQRDKDVVLTTSAVNDIVVSRGNLARLIHLELSAERELIAALRADGLILCTPTGSSAYSYSAGGPLIYPEMDAIGITPICSFLTEIKPFVLPSDKQITVAVIEDVMETYLTLDGQSGYHLQPGDQIHVTGSPRKMLLAAISRDSYFQKLKAKGFIQGG